MPADAAFIASVAAVCVLSATSLTGLGVAVHAYVRRVRSGPAPRPAQDDVRFQRLEQAVDAIAVEVERIGEGQRFVTRLLAERAPAVLPTVPPRVDTLPKPPGRVQTPH